LSLLAKKTASLVQKWQILLLQQKEIFQLLNELLKLWASSVETPSKNYLSIDRTKRDEVIEQFIYNSRSRVNT
jgi:hypothetical protein